MNLIPFSILARRSSGVTFLSGGALLAALTVGLLAPAAQAQTVYLVGADLYSASSTGADMNTGYLYDTNSSTGATTYTLQLVLNGTTYNKGIAIPLAAGANNFTINQSPSGISDPNAYAGLELFFSTTPVSYNPTGTARTPDLVFSSSVATGTTGDFTPAAGVTVASYIYQSTSTANGLTVFPEGSQRLSVSNLAVDHFAAGSFTINEASTAPEPGAACSTLSALPVLIGGLNLRRRKASAA